MFLSAATSSCRQREMVSNALDCLYGKVLKPDDIQLAFARLVGTVDDVALDNPEAYDLLSKFLVRWRKQLLGGRDLLFLLSPSISESRVQGPLVVTHVHLLALCSRIDREASPQQLQQCSNRGPPW